MAVKEWARIAKKIKFDAGHRIPRHGSKCRNLHGHQYIIWVHCRGTIVDERGAADEGMLCDFGILKDFMMAEIHDVLDHGFIVYKEDFAVIEAFDFLRGIEDFDQKLILFPYIPTAENIARWCYEQLKPLVDQHFRGNLVLDRVDVHETDTSVASYPQDLR